MATQEIVLSSAQDQLLNELIASVPRARQLSWLQLSNLKLTTEKQLEGKILEAQQILSGWETMELIPLQAVVEKAKKTIGEMPELRKSFTRYIDKISDSLMEIQKRGEGLEVLSKAIARELELKLKKESDDDEATIKAKEIAAFKAHVQNEYVRISTAYRVALMNHITNSYVAALDTDFTDDGLIDYMNKIAEGLKKIQRDSPVKFVDYKLTPKDKLNEVHGTIPAPNYDQILTEAVGLISQRFTMYHQDKQNAELAKAQVKKETETLTTNATSQAQKIQAVNNLVSKGASTGIVDTLPGAKKVKRKMVIELQDTAEETIKIMSEFLARWDDVAPKLKIKSWANLSIKQMAGALQELDTQIEGLVYKPQVK